MTDSPSSPSTLRARPSAPPDRPKEETARLGNEIYERDIRHQVEPDHHGEVVAIDVETGNWAIGDNVVSATDSLWTQHPAAHDIWSLYQRPIESFGFTW
ncbi:MAG: hypothetical protein OXG65_00845 [Chloroflexi bacterium]|nr:hypothetical protein [Chloroflexota bacterium]